MLSPRENFTRFFRGEDYEWTPTNLDLRRFAPAALPGYVARGLVHQQHPYTGEYGGKDLFGVDWYYDPAAGGSMEKAPLLDSYEDLEDWENIVKFPDLDSIDWQGCADENREYLDTDKLIYTTIYTGFFERLISFVGFEDAAAALVDEEYREYVHALFDRLADFYIELIKRFHRYFGVGLVVLHDDWGSQTSTLFSVNTHTEMILPYVRKVVSAAHEEGVFVEQHSCGSIASMLPNIIRSGADTWRGQASAVDKPALVKTYGDSFKFCVELTLPGPADDKTAMALVEELVPQYKGKQVWFFLSKHLTAKQRENAASRINEILR